MAREKTRGIRPSRQLGFNIGLAVFAVFFLYMIVNVFAYLIRPKYQIYEVGAISNVIQDTSYQGLILRDEVVQTAPTTGYVNVYVREGTRASVGNTVCLMDENGRYTEMLKSGLSQGESNLTRDQLSSLKYKLGSFSASYRSVRFQEIYDIKYNLENQLLSYLNADTLNQIADVAVNISYLKTVTAEESGVVEYYTDGLETLTEDRLTIGNFVESKIRRNALTSGTMVERGSPIYKTIRSEKWNIYLPLTAEDQAAFTGQKKIWLLFHDSNLEVQADFSLFTASDGTTLGRCELTDYMVQWANKRFVSVSVMKSRLPLPKTDDGQVIEKNGLKIPKSSVVTKEFYVVPLSYGTRGGNGTTTGFMQVYSSADTSGDNIVNPTIRARSDTYYYLDMNSVEPGTIFVKTTESQDDAERVPTYIVGSTATLQGVYNVNKGYAYFRPITILDENADYYIIREGQPYGLNVYDHILLNGAAANDGDILY